MRKTLQEQNYEDIVGKDSVKIGNQNEKIQTNL